MAENAFTKKLGPQPRWLWAAEGIGAFLVYRYIKARRAAASSGLTTLTATPLTGGSTIPTDVGQPTATGPTYSTLAQWEEAALAAIPGAGYSATSALNDLSSWLNGSCVSAAGYNAIGNFIQTNGLPPGFSTALPTLSVCPSSSGSSSGSNPSPPPTPPPSKPTLPTLNAQSFPLKVLFGQYGPNDYTKIGTVNNGTYSGPGVIGGAPVYANVFGGFVQDFNMATLPNGTDLYVPTSLVQQGYVPGLQAAA
jgi:hypothetical protein